MSNVNDVLIEEYDRSLRLSNALQKDIDRLPIGSLQKKCISGKYYYYLQYRDGDKVKSNYVKHEEVEDLKKQLQKRKDSINALKEQKKTQSQLGKALGKKFVNERKVTYGIVKMQEDLSPIFKKYKVKKAILFGSYAKGNANKYSDVDILVDSGLKGLKFYGLLEDICSKLSIPVDLIDKSQVVRDSEIEKEINSTGVVIYGR